MNCKGRIDRGDYLRIIAQPESEATLLPEGIVKFFSLLIVIVKGFPIDKAVCEASKSSIGVVEGFCIVSVILSPFFFFGIERSLIHWQTEVRSALVDSELFRNWRYFLYSLNASCARSNDGYSFAF